MAKLKLEDFEGFFREVHGVAPFAWQQRLVTEVAESGRWPDFIDLPTGSGKTACLDVGVFALALSVASKQLAPRRIVLVVDRRLVVDQAYERADRLVRVLEKAASSTAAGRVADALRQISSTGLPLQRALLRGAMPLDDNWASTPDQPLILTSTVDQVGSRLLFRGYGVSPSMCPVHAGLLGTDCLYLLDEVHLSKPFAETVAGVAELSSRLGVPPPRFAVVSLSATPGDVGGKSVFRLEKKERAGPIERRLTASKPVMFKVCDAEDFGTEVCRETKDLLGRHRSVLVVSNRVARAHDAARKLKDALAGDVEVVLLTGRMRPVDRDEVVARIASVRSGGERSGARPQLVVVATQCIEAGADLDFDAIVTELAALDSLRQRFGRVDRLGEYGKAEGVILQVRELSEAGKHELPKDDPVYGGALVACAKLLKDLAPKKKALDFGVNALDGALPADVSEALAPRRSAPALLPAYLDAWAQTAPRPAVEPKVPLFLHGPEVGPADVSIVWRADLDGVSDDEVAARIEALPPTTLEAVSVPFAAAKAWLARGDRVQISDVEFDRERDGAEPRSTLRDAWVWGREVKRLTSDALKPGMTVVVKSAEAGLYEHSFDGAPGEPVEDRAEEAFRRARGRAAVRLELQGVTEAGDDLLPPPGAPEWLARACEQVGPRPTRVELDGWTCVISRRRVSLAESPDVSTDEVTSPHVGRKVSLTQHSKDIERWARQFLEALRLPEDQAAAVAFAAWLHDVGKADPRFQRMLREGSEVALRVDQRAGNDWVLAKSELAPHERRRAVLAQQRSGYPRGSRHEVLSLAMCDAPAVREAAVKRGAKDFDLVLHLIASHHGWCRPFAPAVEDAASGTVELRHGDLQLQAPLSHQLHRVGSGVADRFGRLLARYGWHQLACLEAVLRLADHRASEEEANGDA